MLCLAWLGPVRSRLVPLSTLWSVWSRRVWFCLVLFGPAWSRLVLFGPVGSRLAWSCLVPLGPVWSCFVPLGPVRSPLVPLGPVWSRFVWSRLVLFGPDWSRFVWYCLVRVLCRYRASLRDRSRTRDPKRNVWTPDRCWSTARPQCSRL